MPLSFLETLDGASHEQIQLIQDPSIGFSAILAIHDTRLGPAFGGVRRFPYRNGTEALRDVMRLSRAMTNKCLLTGVMGGGGKVALIDRPGLDLQAVYRRLGEFIQNLGGRYYSGPDVGTGAEELEAMAEVTEFVTLPGPKGPGDLSAATARGVLAGIRAVLRFLARKDRRFPSDPSEGSWEGLRFAVQGFGEVGYKVAEGIVQRGGHVIGAEVQVDRLERAIDNLGIDFTDPGEIFDVPCEVFVPCALGGILHDLSIERLQCRAVAGSANNILASPEHGLQLAGREILVAPDFVINSGALILGANFHLTGNRDQKAAIDKIEERLFRLFEEAEREGKIPTMFADEAAEERLHSLPKRVFFP